MPGTHKDKGKTQGAAIRTFVCLEIPETIRERIAELQSSLKQIDAHVSWVKPANIHLTLKFLGDVSPSRIARVCEAVERAAGSSSPFEVEVNGSGCFPSPRNPRVLWIGLGDLPHQLRRLHMALEDDLAREGFPREEKRFAPHLTIGRIRSPHDAARVAEELIARGFNSETFPAASVIVMRSELHPTGSIYTPQAVIPLGKIAESSRRKAEEC